MENEQPVKNEASEDMAEVCKNCLKWEAFGRKCWVYWDKKKACSHFEDEVGNFGKGLNEWGFS